MPNKKLKEKLGIRASKINELQIKNRLLSAKSLGALAFEKLKGSYGVTINPFPEPLSRELGNGTSSHSQFREGFNSAKHPKPIQSIIITPNIVHQSTGANDAGPNDFMAI